MSDSTPEVDRSGTVVAGKYRVEKLIARGGFSSVYRAQQIGMDRAVALKILELGDKADATTTERFIREARLVSQLTHPNTITIFDFGQAADYLFIAMEYVKGRSLSRQIKKYGALHPDDAAKVALDILKSLDEAHARGILHRDMKPSNIMLGRDHTNALAVRVLDFGVAKILEPMPDMSTKLTQAGVFVGTPRYASPEQMKREELTPASDIYGVGMVLWESLVGEPAVVGLDFASAVEGHLSSKPWRLPENIVCPPALAHILYKSLEKKPANRYQTCKEMIDDLERWTGEADQAPTWSLNPDTGESQELSAFEPEAWFGEEPPKPTPPRTPKAAFVELPAQPEPEARPRRKTPPTTRANPDIVQGLSVDTSALRPVRPVIAPVQAAGGSTKKPAMPNRNLIIAIVAGVVLLAIGVGIGIKMGSNEPETASAPQTMNVLPRVATEGIVLAIRTAGWEVRNFDESSYDDVAQTSFMAEKDRRKAAVTVYECETDHLAGALLKDTELPSEAVQFGRTIVRVSPGPSNEGNGVQQLTAMLFAFRGMMEEQGKL